MKIFNTFTEYFLTIIMNLREIEYSRHFLVLAHGDYFPKNAFAAGKIFAKSFNKGLTMLVWESQMSDEFALALEEEKKSLGDVPFICESVDGGFEDIVQLTERTETPMIFIEFSKKRGFYRPMNFFKGFRDLRIPFIMMKDTMAEYPGVPYVLFGHSMGSFMARTILAKYPESGISAAIICGTAGPNPAASAGIYCSRV